MTNEVLSLEDLIFEAVEFEIADHILTIRLNRPERKNAINSTMSNELIYLLDYAKQERSIRVVVLGANGDIFCAGGDLRSMSGRDGSEVQSNVPARGTLDDISLRIRYLNMPVIARIQGHVLAGALLIVCNVTHAIAAEKVKFSAPEIKRGLWPFMVMAGLFRLMPKRAGLDFIMQGEAIDANTAEKWGLINESVAAEKLDERVDHIAKNLANLAPTTMQMGLAAYVEQEDMAFVDAMPYLRDQLNVCLKSDDAKEGITAFLEKREPQWD
jgi:enoyl-CoA hydratase/carnithine racemase